MIKVLVVDDDEVARSAIAGALEVSGLAVTTAHNVPEALKLIVSEKFDVLLSDLHMPGAGDGLTAVSAMRHANPEAVTLLLSAYPRMGAAAQAILLQADEILAKPMDLGTLVNVVKHRASVGPVRGRAIESVGQILERSVESTMQRWYQLVEKNEKLQCVVMSFERRTGHIPQLFRELVARLKDAKEFVSSEVVSVAAAAHGASRRKAGYSAALLVEESRMLQASIFGTLQINVASIDFSALLIGVMTIADEIDLQLRQAMASYQHDCPVAAPGLQGSRAESAELEMAAST